MLPWILLGLFLVGQVQSSPFFDFLTLPQYHQNHYQEHESYREEPITPLILSQISPLDKFSQVRVSTPRQNSFSQNYANNPFRTIYNSPFDVTRTNDGGHIEVQPEFVPLEEQPRVTQAETKPFDVDLISTSANANGGGSVAHVPGLFFKQSFPFLGNDFLNPFGGFDFTGGAQEWWKGPNVCVEKSEEEQADKEITKKPATDKEAITGDQEKGSSEVEEISPPLFGQFHFSLNSCIEKPNKYVCTRIINQNGKKKTVTVTRQCCRGYARPRNADFQATCEKVDIKSVEKTAEELGAKQFVESAKTAGGNEIITRTDNVTIFMPLDEALARYNDQLQNENNVVGKANGDNFYMRHMVNGDLSLYDVTNEQVFETKEPGQSIRINVYQVPLALATEPFRYTANCVPVEKHDKLTEHGLAHTINGVLTPVKQTIMDLIRERSDLSIVRTVLENTKLSEMLEGDKPMTIFAPTDDAFNKVEPHIRRALKEGKSCALNILKNHMLDLTFCSVASIAGAKTTAYNLLGEALNFNRSKAEEWSEAPVKINGLATIQNADIMATNGVLHVIDTILPTESAMPLSALMQAKNVTLFQKLLNASGLYEVFDDMENVTIFAPTDKALRESKWIEILEKTPEQLAGNKELEEFINYHVVKPMTKTCDLKETLYPTLAGSDVRVNLYSTHSLFSNVMNRATVNCARLVHFDDESCSSVLHQVDKVLIPQKTNLLEQLEANPQYSRFLKLVKSANLTSLLSDASKQGYTLLVPKNDVFEEVADWEQTLTENQAELQNLVKTHIVSDVVCCAGIIPTQWPFVRSVEALNGAHLHITRDRRPKIENAGITKCDNVATNGIIHEINDIIVPKRKSQNNPQIDQLFI